MQKHVTEIENKNSNNGVTFPFASGNRQNSFTRQNESTEFSMRQNVSVPTKVKPQLYDGSTDLDEYLTQFNIIAEINGWNNDAKALYLASSLSGSARSLLSEIDSDNRRSFSKLLSALQCRFGTVNRAEVYRAQLKNRVRQRSETIPELAQNIRKLTRQAYPGANSDLIDTLALDHFIDSLLDSEMRLRLRECSPKNIQEAETLAVKMEAQRIADRQRSKNVGSLSQTSENVHASPDIQKMAETVKSLVESIEKLQNRQGSKDDHPRSRNGYRNNDDRYRQNRSQRPNSNYNARNQYRTENWNRNRKAGDHINDNFIRSQEQRHNDIRPLEQRNNFLRPQQQGNEIRSSMGTAARPQQM
ncbi:MAG: hypothetical protein JAZ03_03345 [Candidatus Thiodiazotropha taylori]|nr:hypothetical protein [Candidatus Thiodiazotropha taylori]MCW4332962.1 hypothetical protein [Candidatus Thiodiazotropha endolucinida]